MQTARTGAYRQDVTTAASTGETAWLPPTARRDVRTVAGDPFAAEIPVTLVVAIVVVLLILLLVVFASPVLTWSCVGLIVGSVLGIGKFKARGKR